MYAITVQVEHTAADGWRGSYQVPTFFLEERVQGIVSEEHAENIAREVVLAARSWEAADDVVLHVTAVKV